MESRTVTLGLAIPLGCGALLWFSMHLFDIRPSPPLNRTHTTHAVIIGMKRKSMRTPLPDNILAAMKSLWRTSFGEVGDNM